MHSTIIHGFIMFSQDITVCFTKKIEQNLRKILMCEKCDKLINTETISQAGDRRIYLKEDCL